MEKRLKEPTHRYDAVLKVFSEGGVPSENTPEYGLYLCMQNLFSTQDNIKTEQYASVTYAFDIFSNTEHRPVMDAFLLAEVDANTIHSVLQIPSEVTQMYKYLFMDVGVLRNRLEKNSYVNRYPGTRQGKDIVRTAIASGADYLLWLYNAGGVVDTRQVIKQTMSDAFYRGQAHKLNSLTGDVSKECLKWWKVAVRNAEILDRIDPPTRTEAADELRIALTKSDNTIPEDKSPVPVMEILH